MAPKWSQPSGSVDWVRRVNGRWIAHHGLKQSAEAFLAHLEATDPGRLSVSCDRAAQLVHSCEPGEDPKPWFYAGLFSLATVEEAKQFLADHWFTAACVSSISDSLSANMEPDHLAADTQAKLARIRQVLANLKSDS